MFPKNLLMKNPAGTWSFVARVNVRLGWKNKDGSELTDDDCAKLVQCSSPGMLFKVKVYASPEAAKAEADRLGLEVSEQ
jgi:hypothetical protein